MTPEEYLKDSSLRDSLIDFDLLCLLMKGYARKEIIAAVKHGIENCEDKGDKWNDAAAERYYNENYGS